MILETVTRVAVTQARCFNCNRAAISKVGRAVYKRMYPTLIVKPDGSSISVRYHEPRKIVMLPLDIDTLTGEERLVRLERRKPKKQVVVEEDFDDGFSADSYSYLWKK